MAEERTFTQEEVNKLVGQARLEGKEAGRKDFEGYISPEDMDKQLAGLNDQLKALTEEKTGLEAKITEKDGQLAKYEIDSVKTRIAREYGLSYDAIGFIQGEDEETIKKSAEALKGLVGSKEPAPVVVPLGNPEQPPEEDGVTAAFKRLNPKINI